MDISCEIIRDLLPLYAENLVSEDSKKMVDEHLCGCDPCTRQLAIMKKAAQLPVEVDTSALQRVGNIIRRRRILAVLTTLLFVVTLVLSGALFLDARIYLTAEQAIEYVEGLEDGSIRVHWSDEITVAGISGLGSGSRDSDTLTRNYGIIAWAPLTGILFPRERLSYEEIIAQLPAEALEFYSKEEYNVATYQLEGGAVNHNFWYCDAKDGTGKTLIWDAGNLPPEGPFVEVNYHLAYYCAILAVLAGLLLILGRKYHGKWYGELCNRVAIMLGSLSLSAVIVSAGQFMELYGEFTEHVIDSSIVAIPMTLTGLCSCQLHKLNKQDKGE